MEKYFEQLEDGNRITVILKAGEPYSEDIFQKWEEVPSGKKIPCLRIWYNGDVHLVYSLEKEWRRLSDIKEALDEKSLYYILSQMKELLENLQGTGVPFGDLIMEDSSIQVDEEGGIHVMCFPIARRESEQVYEQMLEQLEGQLRPIRERWEAEEARRNAGFQLISVDTPVPVCFSICQEKFIVGKGTEGTDGRVPDVTTISRCHAQFGWVDGKAFLMDLSSTNGTFVNGEQIPPMVPVEIAPGDVIGLANYIFCVESGEDVLGSQGEV